MVLISSFILSQILVFIAIITDFIGFQFKQREKIVIMLAISSILISTHYFLLNKYVAGCLVIVSIIKYFTAYKTTSKYALWFFVIISFILFFYFYIGPLDIIVLTGSVLGTFSSFQKDDKYLRLIGMSGTSFFILYNILIFSPLAIVLESIFLCSNFLGYYRYYIRKQK